MEIFQLVDRTFDKFSGFAMNIDLAVMLHCGEHSVDQRDSVNYYLLKNQKKIEREATQRSIQDGKDYIAMSQASYIERYKNNNNFNEEGELVYSGNYTYE